jgi:hypothetical protein
MMTTIKITQIMIDQITDVVVDEVEPSELGWNNRTITIWTLNGEKYQLILQSSNVKNLEFRKAGDWLKPLVYKGKPTDKEEED